MATMNCLKCLVQRTVQPNSTTEAEHLKPKSIVTAFIVSIDQCACDESEYKAHNNVILEGHARYRINRLLLVSL